MWSSTKLRSSNPCKSLVQLKTDDSKTLEVERLHSSSFWSARIALEPKRFTQSSTSTALPTAQKVPSEVSRGRQGSSSLELSLSSAPKLLHFMYGISPSAVADSRLPSWIKAPHASRCSPAPGSSHLRRRPKWCVTQVKRKDHDETPICIDISANYQARWCLGPTSPSRRVIQPEVCKDYCRGAGMSKYLAKKRLKGEPAEELVNLRTQ